MLLFHLLQHLGVAFNTLLSSAFKALKFLLIFFLFLGHDVSLLINLFALSLSLLLEFEGFILLLLVDTGVKAGYLLLLLFQFRSGK
jgi:hypothetical protein